MRYYKLDDDGSIKTSFILPQLPPPDATPEEAAEYQTLHLAEPPADMIRPRWTGAGWEEDIAAANAMRLEAAKMEAVRAAVEQHEESLLQAQLAKLSVDPNDATVPAEVKAYQAEMTK